MKLNKKMKVSNFHEENLNEFGEAQRTALVAEQFIVSWGLMNLFLQNKSA